MNAVRWLTVLALWFVVVSTDVMLFAILGMVLILVLAVPPLADWLQRSGW